MEQCDSIPLEFRNKYIKASSGFALDIGNSTAKLVFRSKKDYADGEPIKDELKGLMGRIYVVPSIPLTHLGDVIEIIRTRCDLRQQPDDTKPEVCTTGSGCNFYRRRLETDLNIRLTNANEMHCFVKAYVEMAKHTMYNDLFIPREEKTAATIKANGAVRQKYIKSFSSWGMDTSNLATADDIAAGEATEKAALPCVISMCGSGVGCLIVFEDGTFKLDGMNVFAGRAFLGLTALLTGQKDYGKIMGAIERGSCEGVDEYAVDLVPATSDNETDSYDVLRKVNRPVFPFGKAVTRHKDEIPDDDILHSLYRSFLVNIVDGARAQCVIYGMKNLYFCGNFVQNPMARHIIECHNAAENCASPKDRLVYVKFIKHGGHLGALGAFLENAQKSV